MHRPYRWPDQSTKARARLEDIPQPTRDAVAEVPCPSFDTAPFVSGPPLAERRVAIVSAVSALAHMLETSGTPTVAVGLVRPQMERTRPPRGLWTPFELGRPLGEPGDAEFQRRVLLRALRLLERRDGPVVLEDFSEDPPNLFDTVGWQPPALPAIASPDSPAGWGTAFRREMDALRPAWLRARIRYGRTTIGFSGQTPELWPTCVARFLAGELPTVPPHATAALTLRFLCDDIKAMYSEAAQADGPPPSSRQIDTWFWSQTTAGKLLIALRAMAVHSENNALRTVGGRFQAPAPYLPT